MDRLQKRLLREVTRASGDFGLIEPGDRILVAVSGGKDSFAMLHLLREAQRRVPFDYSLIAVNLDQGHPGFPADVLESYFRDNGYEYRMLKEDTYSVVLDKIPAGKTYCSLCSRLRRGILYDAAVELGCNKLALGHHKHDTVETLLLNLLYSGQIKAMPPKLRSDDGRNIVIRPLIYCHEPDLAEFAALMRFPIIPCDLCGSQENLQRKKVKKLIADLDAENGHVLTSLFAALSNVRPSHLLDPELRARFGVDAAMAKDEHVMAIGESTGCAHHVEGAK